mgnify:CR=1 FL=1
MRYAIVIEKATNNYSAYVPDLPGCIATAATIIDTYHPISIDTLRAKPLHELHHEYKQ